MSWYRNTYLKSEDWLDLRAAKLAHSNSACSMCLKEFDSLDVHHLQYKNIYDVRMDDLRVVCRDCHKAIHSLMGKYPKLKKLPNELQWKTVFHHISPFRRNGEYRKNLKAQWKRARCIHRASTQFSICRNVLVGLGLASRGRLKFKPSFAQLYWFVATNPVLFLRAYMNFTRTDPRTRPDRVGPHKLLTF